MLFRSGDTNMNMLVFNTGPIITNTAFFLVGVRNAICSNVITGRLVTVAENFVRGDQVFSSQTLCYGSPHPTLLGNASGSGPLSYLWQSNTIGCSGPWNSINNSNSASFNPGGTVTVTTYYRYITYSTTTDGIGGQLVCRDRKSTRLNSSHSTLSRMPSSA